MKLQAIMAMALLATAACQSAVPEGGGAGTAGPAVDPTEATLSGEACPDIGERAYFFWMEPRSAEPGDQIALSPYWTDMPGGYNQLPPGCLGDLEVYPEGAASFARQDDGLAIATIGSDVASGTRMRLDGTYRGEHRVSGPVEVYRAAENPLVGTWTQAAEGCPPESAVRELVFSGGGEFSVTWTPFEVYKDYWGSYDYDVETGALSLEVESGNQVPEDIVSEGRAVIKDNMLDLDGIFFGTPRQATEGCRASFKR